MRGRRGFGKWVPVLALAATILIPAHSASAADMDLGGYSAGDKLARGLANTFLGILEIPRNIQNTTQEENNLLEGWTVGLGKGLGYSILRIGTGLYETVTFPFPLPEGYRPIVEPEFVWEARGPAVVPVEARE